MYIYICRYVPLIMEIFNQYLLLLSVATPRWSDIEYQQERFHCGGCFESVDGTSSVNYAYLTASLADMIQKMRKICFDFQCFKNQYIFGSALEYFELL